MAKARRNFSFKFLLALRFSFFHFLLHPFVLFCEFFISFFTFGVVTRFCVSFFLKVFICFVLQNSMCVFPSKISHAMFQLKTPPLKHFSATFCFSHLFRVERFLSYVKRILNLVFNSIAYNKYAVSLRNNCLVVFCFCCCCC